MDSNDNFFDKELNFNWFYMHAIFRQKYPKPAVVNYLSERYQLLLNDQGRQSI